MAKRSRSTGPAIEVTTAPKKGAKARKRLKRLAQELAELRAAEAKRVDQLKKIRARAVDVRARLTAVRATVAATTGGPGSEAAGAGPIGYCMREKQRVQITDSRPVTLSNGRAAIAGTCSICGARVMVLSPRLAQD